MKKVFQSAMILSLVFLSCTDEVDRTENITGVVGFHTADVPASRAAILTDLKPAGFLVNAYSTGTGDWASVGSAATPGFMYNQPVTWNSGAWTYGTAKYWPGNNGMISFFAWNEGTGATVSGNDETGAPTLTYTVPDVQGDQKDLVTAMVTDQTANTNNGAVPLTFGHVLSRIGFTAKLDKEYPGVTVKITSLKVKYAAGKVRKTDDYIFGTGWALTGTDCMPTGDDDELVSAPGIALNNSATPAKTDLTTAAAANYLMLLPQTVEAGGVEIEVEWTVDGGTPPNKQSVYLPAQTWEPGKRYDYNLTVSQTDIKFDMTVTMDEWNDENAAYSPCLVTYNANEGTGADIIRPWITHVKYPLLDEDVFSHPQDYILSGWNTKADGSGNNYLPRESFTCDDNITLYAQWVKARMYDDPAVSNCYMITPGGTKSFPVRRAYAHIGSRLTNTLHTGGTYYGKFKVEVVWDDAGVIDEVEVEGSGKDAVVTVKTKDPGTSPNGGNAVVKIYKKDDGTQTPVWSYHIWVTDPDAIGTWHNDRQAAATYTFMDRNLGATEAANSVTGRGLFYQWGRKDPFCTGEYTTVSVSSSCNIPYSIQHPATFITCVSSPRDWLYGNDRKNDRWNADGNTKSIYDPCPEGWRVPLHVDGTESAGDDSSPWKGYSTASSWTAGASDGGVQFINQASETSYYPAGGYIDFETGIIGGLGTFGNWFSASVNGESARNLGVRNNGQVQPNNQHRAFGFSVRCIRE
jgi:hypothetical protein